MQGVIKGITDTVVMLELDSPVDHEVGDVVEVTIGIPRKRRSLSANAYFHVLVDKIRTALKIGLDEAKNDLICSYGQVEYIGDEQAIIKTNVPPEVMRKNGAIHCQLVKAGREGDTETYFYRLYRGSHTYTPAEMGQLIDGTISEAKELGIETLTPDELARLEGYEKQGYR